LENIKSKPNLLWLGKKAPFIISGLVKMIFALFRILLLSFTGVSPSYTPAEILLSPKYSRYGKMARYWSFASAFVG
jgi:hypothetical protein